MKKLSRFYSLFTILLMPYVLLCQQTEIAPVTNTFALKNVHVTTAPGQVFEGATIIVEDGLISQIGTNVSIPVNAQILEGDSMYVYAGFIAGLSYAGISREEDNQDNQRPNFPPGNPPDEEAGITPEKDVKSILNAKEKSIGDLRENGFVISHSVPRGRMLPGKGSLILLLDGDTDELLLKENVSLFSQFTGARRMYPATIIAMMAKWRDLYHQAKFADVHENNYLESPAGMNRPKYSSAIKGLYPVVNKEIPVFFNTQDILSAYRALKLSEELGFNIVLSELKQGWTISEKIKENEIPVLVSLDLPKKAKENAKKEGEESAKKITQLEQEKENLNKRVLQSKAEYLAQASVFEKAGVSFAFSFLEVKPKDILPNIRRLIESGLSKETALSSLTTYPAELLGIESITGTLEEGKMANLLVSNKPIFEENAQIKYVLVDGKKYEYEVKPEKKKSSSEDAAGSAPALDLSGTWVYEIEVPNMAVEGKMLISKSGDTYTIEISNDQNPGETRTVEDLTPENNNLTFTIEIDNDGFQMVLDYDIDFVEDTLEGSVTAGQFGTFPLSGDKISNPN